MLLAHDLVPASDEERGLPLLYGNGTVDNDPQALGWIAVLTDHFSFCKPVWTRLKTLQIDDIVGKSTTDKGIPIIGV
jgi:hypothetical protein